LTVKGRDAEKDSGFELFDVPENAFRFGSVGIENDRCPGAKGEIACIAQAL